MRMQLLIGLFSLSLVGCGASEKNEGTTAAKLPAYCPPAGATVPLAQLVAQPKKFKGCDVSTEAALMGPYTMATNFLMDQFVKKGRTLFQLGIPGAGPQPMGMFASLGSVDDGAANTLFSTPGNAIVKLRGRFEYKGAMMGTDLGGASRCFQVETVTVESTAAK